MGDVLAAVGLAGQLFSGAMSAYHLFRAAIDFPDDYETLEIRLDAECARLDIWGRNSGASAGSLHPDVAPFVSIINDILGKTTRLLQDSERLRENYGLRSEDSLADDAGRPTQKETQRSKVVAQVKSVFRSVAGGPKDAGKAIAPGAIPHSSASSHASTTPHSDPIPSTIRLRWAIADKARFERLIKDIRRFTNSLNELLNESRQTSIRQEWRRAEMQVVVGIDDPEGLQIVEEATEGDTNYLDMYSMARRKSIVMSKRGLDRTSSSYHTTINILAKQDFDLPSDFSTLSRCFAVYNPRFPSPNPPVPNSTLVLIEKKRYDPDISSDDKGTLLFRIHRLIDLLNSSPEDTHSSTLLRCIGYWTDPENNCWRLVFPYPTSADSRATISPSISGDPASRQPLSLLLFLQSDSYRPPLESRLQLASTIATVFSHLYGSKWLHKGVRSANILFPHPSAGVYDISQPIISGFEYSRQYTEQASIYHTPFDIQHAIYRHPNYQGDAAKGYRIGYDIYSLGLVLSEIAWWVPLGDILTAMRKRREEARTTAKSSTSVSAGGGVGGGAGYGLKFDADDASELSKEVRVRVQKELAFKVGTPYREAVEWCLQQGFKQALEKKDGEVAMEFYSKVVVPLENAAYRRI